MRNKNFAGFNAFGFSSTLLQGDDDTQTVINLAATAELFATTHYLAAINGDLGLEEEQIAYLKAAFIAEQDHLELLISLGAEPVVTEFYVPETLFSDKALFAQITEVAETTFVAAYLAATRIFAAAGQTAFAVTTAQIAAVEAEHRSLAREIGELVPNNISYAQFQFDNVSGAVPVLQPFLDGSGEGFVGPVAPPTPDQIAAIRAEASALGYGSAQPFAAMDIVDSGSSDSAASSGACMVTAGNQGANLRSEPSINAAVAGSLGATSSIDVDGQRTGADGFIWWRTTRGSWVRSDAVSQTDACASVPTV